MRDFLLRAARACGLFALARWRTRRQLRILCYHGLSVGDQHRFEPILFMRPEVFAARMKRLRERRWRVVDLDTAVRELADGTLRPHTVAVTMDDGWVSSLTLGGPVLRATKIPCTLYVTSYYVERRAEVFNVAVRYLLWKSTARRVTLSTGYRSLDGEYDLTADRSSIAEAWIEAANRELDWTQRQALLPLLAASLEVDADYLFGDARFRIMEPAQIAACGEFGLDVQLHTHRHHLPASSMDAMQTEIADNRERLERWKGEACEHFCYPSGVYSPEQPEWLRALGLRSSTTCDFGFNASGAHPHRLRRILDRDTWSDVEFEAAMCGIVGGLWKLGNAVESV